jgi:hypothetical protein
MSRRQLILPVYDFLDQERMGKTCIVINTPGISGANLWDGQRWTTLSSLMLALIECPPIIGEPYGPRLHPKHMHDLDHYGPSCFKVGCPRWCWKGHPMSYGDDTPQ